MRGKSDDFEDDGVSFRMRRIEQLDRQMRAAAWHNTPTFRLIRAVLLFILPFLIFFVGTVLVAGTSAVIGALR